MFEKGKVYTYEQITEIVHKTAEEILGDLEEKAEEHLDSHESQLIIKIHTSLIVSMFESLLLHGKGE